MEGVGEQENFITVFPTALKWCFTDDGIEEFQTRWVNGNVIENPCSGPPQDYVDDVQFLKLLVSRINDSFSINQDKVYASGFSNGSAMVHKLAMVAGDVFTAVAGSSGALSITDTVSNPPNRIPIWYILGNQDPKFIHPPFIELPFGGDSILIYMQSTLTRFLSCQGLTESFNKNETPIMHSYLFNESRTMTDSKPFLFTLVKDMIHIYPNGNNFPISAPHLFWEFFKQSSLVDVKNEFEKSNIVSIYPNPSSDFIQIKINQNPSDEPLLFQVFNALGKVVQLEQPVTEKTVFLRKSEVGSCIFYLHFRAKGYQETKVVCIL